MARLTDTLDPQHAIRNIIFDFGNVICDIDISKTEEKFRDFGPARREEEQDPQVAGKRFEELVAGYEAGLVSSETFRSAIRNHYLSAPSDQQIDEAWNALLGEIPERRISLLQSLRSGYRLFLLSNSNEIHYQCYIHEFRRKSGLHEFDELFEKAYFSFQMGMTKPSPEIFKKVMEDQHLHPEESLFIDDTLKHVQAARSIGIPAVHLPEGTDICSLFI